MEERGCSFDDFDDPVLRAHWESELFAKIDELEPLAEELRQLESGQKGGELRDKRRMTKRAARIRKELEQIQKRNRDGLLVSEEIVKFARKSPKSALHSCFEWDVDKAAWEHWIDQARRLVRIYVYETDEPVETENVVRIREFVSLPSDRAQGGGYRKITDVMSDPPRRKEYTNFILSELKRFKARYEGFREFADVWDAIGRLREEREEGTA